MTPFYKNHRDFAGETVAPPHRFGFVRTAMTNQRIHADGMLEEDLDRLPFGAIQLDMDGKVLKYNDYESRLALRS
ncbi:MAG: hypothetical protein ACRD2S_06880 [Terriglobales bacterium]